MTGARTLDNPSWAAKSTRIKAGHIYFRKSNATQIFKIEQLRRKEVLSLLC